MKDILIGKADIKTLLNGNYIYVDKTKYIYNLIQNEECYFLSRPRRFGKSLLISTFIEVFSGNKELFKDCCIYNSNYDWKSYPIIHLDFGERKKDLKKDFYNSLLDQLNIIAKDYDLIINDDNIIGYFSSLIRQLYEKSGPIVFLVDEYDKPILDNIDNLEEAEKNRDILGGLFSTAKSLSGKFRFQFITGITKFAKTSLFSGANNLNDISMSLKYNCLLGYTQNELEFYFKEYLIETLKSADVNSVSLEDLLNKIKYWYNGYLFTKSLNNTETVYNPFSILNFFSRREFDNYWFESGTSTYLVKLLKKYSYDAPKDENNIFLDIEQLNKFEIDKINLLSLLFQAGYLTIDSFNLETQIIKLRYPNSEVEVSFKKQIKIAIEETFNESLQKEINNFKLYLKNEDWNNIFELFKSLYASIPYTVARNESWYSSMFFQAFQSNGFRCEMEGLTNKGRTDMMLYINNIIYIIEFKYNKSAQEAIDQIKNNHYYEKYLIEKLPIIFIGVNFSELRRNINDWKVEEFIYKLNYE